MKPFARAYIYDSWEYTTFRAGIFCVGTSLPAVNFLKTDCQVLWRTSRYNPVVGCYTAVLPMGWHLCYCLFFCGALSRVFTFAYYKLSNACQEGNLKWQLCNYRKGRDTIKTLNSFGHWKSVLLKLVTEQNFHTPSFTIFTPRLMKPFASIYILFCFGTSKECLV